MIRFERVTCRYDRDAAPALVDVDLEIDRRDFVGVVGPSGSGKTTLLRALTGAIEPTSGRLVRDADLTIGYVPQVETVDWNFPVTVAECILMARRGRRLPWATTAERADMTRILERLGIADLQHRHIRQLSGGQQQRVFIARALLSRPQLLVLDEPTSGVDVRTRHDVVHLLRDLHHQGLAVVLTTHDLNGMAAHLPRLVCLNREVIADGVPRDVLTSAVLEATYGARMEVLEHGGMPVVVEQTATRAPIEVRA